MRPSPSLKLQPADTSIPPHRAISAGPATECTGSGYPKHVAFQLPGSGVVCPLFGLFEMGDDGGLPVLLAACVQQLTSALQCEESDAGKASAELAQLVPLDHEVRFHPST